MATYTQQVSSANDGRYLVSNGNWSASDNTSSLAGNGGFTNRFTSVTVPQGAVVLSATWRLNCYIGGPTSAFVWLIDDAPTPGYNFLSSATESAHTAAISAQTRAYDVTAQVQQVISRAGWASGNAIALTANWDGTGSTPYFRHNGDADAGTLTIEYATTQYLDAAGAVGAVAEVLPPDSVQRALNAVPVTASAQVLAPQVVAPRSLTVAPVDSLAQALTPGLSGTGDAPPLSTAAAASAQALVLAPTLAITVPAPPPPIPWERLIEDPAYHAALAGRAPRRTSRAEIVSPDGAVIARLGGTDPTHPGALSGTVTCDGNASIRWECDLVLDNPDLMPRSPSDLLHPLSHNRIRLWWGIYLPDGTLGEIPVGTYYPDLTPTSDDGQRLGVTIKGSSAVAEVKRARWDTALDLGGSTISEAIYAILADRAPWATVAITPTTQTVPASYEPGAPGEDPWDDVEALAAAAGMVAYEDRMGTIRVEERPSGGPPRAEFVEGAGTALVELPSVETDLDWVVNRVTVASASPDVEPPVTGVASDDDPSSPLWVGHGHLYSRRVENAIITTHQAAETMARNILVDRAPVVTVQALVHPHPHLDPGDTVTVGRARAGVAGAHTLTGWTLGLTPGDMMQITATSRKELS